jgi:hypothetical protein
MRNCEDFHDCAPLDSQNGERSLSGSTVTLRYVAASLGVTDAAEKFLRPIRAGAVHRICLFVVDALHFKSAIQAVPRNCIFGVDNRSLGEASADERCSLSLALRSVEIQDSI